MTSHSVSRRAFLGASAAGALLGLAACAGSDGAGGDGAPAGPTSTEGRGTINVGVAHATHNFDPAMATTPLAVGANRNVVEGLYGIGLADGAAFPELAEADPVQVGETDWEVTIREGARFSDGTEVAAQDVAASFQRTVEEGTPLAHLLSSITGVTAKDARTVRVTTDVANHPLLRERLALVRVTPAAQSASEVATRPVGSGPWMYEVTGDAVVDLVPNPNYNGARPAQDAKIRYRVAEDASERASAQADGLTQVMEEVDPKDASRLESAGCVVEKTLGPASFSLVFDVAKAPWNDVRVRQAALFALDRDQMVQDALGGAGEASTGWVPSSSPHFHEAAVSYPKDLDRARQLISDAGVTPGVVELRCADDERSVALAAQVKRDLDALGFSVTVRSDSMTATHSAIDQGGNRYDLLLERVDPSCFGSDPDLLLGWLLASDTWMRVRCPWGQTPEHAALLDLMREALEAADDQARQERWDACVDLLSEHVPLWPLVFEQVACAWWDDPHKSPSRVAVRGIAGSGAPIVDLASACTTSA